MKKSIYMPRVVGSIVCAAIATTCIGSLTASIAVASKSAPAPRLAATGTTEGGKPVSNTATPRLRYRIAVDQGKWDEIRYEQWAVPADVRAGIQAVLVDKLQKSGFFQVMERERTAQGQMHEEDLIDAKKREGLAGGGPAAPRAQRTSARYIITPTVIGFAVTDGSSKGIRIPIGPLRIGRRTQKQKATLKLSIRIFDSATSALLDTETAQGEHESASSGIEGGFAGIRMDDQKFRQSAVGTALELALDDAVAKIVSRLSREPWSALVAAQDAQTGRVIINVGTTAGIEAGQTFDIYQAGAPVLDPETGDVLSNGDEVKIGRIRITRAEANVAYGDVLNGKTFAARNVVRLPQ